MLFKLVSGEEIIVSDFVNVDKKVILISNPYGIHKEIKGDVSNIFLYKWIPYADNANFPLDKTSIITYNAPSEKLADYYMTCLKEEYVTNDEYPNAFTADTTTLH